MVLKTTPVTENGWQAVDFRLMGTDGNYYCLHDIQQSKGFVVAFICNHCPYVQSIADKIARDAADLAKLGVGFVGINANDYDHYPDDSYENMIAFAQQHGFNFPYLIDHTQEIASDYDAVCTPDFYGFDSKGLLRYRGRLDESGRNNLPKARRDLYEAMKAISQNQEIDFDIKPSMGCSIKWRD